jgi:hypothetical protein
VRRKNLKYKVEEQVRTDIIENKKIFRMRQERERESKENEKRIEGEGNGLADKLKNL